MPIDARERRLGLNEALFREVNAQVRELSDEAGLETIEILCECGDADCTEKISMSADEYTALRADSSHFATMPGHDAPTEERVIDRRGDYVIVKKLPAGPRRLAADTDPAS